MKHLVGQSTDKRTSLLILPNDTFINIFQLLDFVDFINFGSTCSRLRDVANNMSNVIYRKIAVKNGFDVNIAHRISQEQFLNGVSVIGSHVLFAELRHVNQFIVEAIQENCQNLISVNLCCVVPPKLHCFRKLKELKVEHSHISITDWKIIFSHNPELETLDNNSWKSYENGFLGILEMLPQLKSLGLPELPDSFHRDVEFQHLNRLAGLKKLTLRSQYNCNDVLIELTTNIDLVELNIKMSFNPDSLGIIKSFKNCEYLYMKLFGTWEESQSGFQNIMAGLSNAASLPPNLKRLKICHTTIALKTFLSIVERLECLEEFDIDEGEIYWDDDKSVGFKDSRVIYKIDDELKRWKRNVKIIYWDVRDSSVLFKSSHLTIANRAFNYYKDQFRGLFVQCT